MDKPKSSGFKLTPQRLAIMNYLKGNKEHPSADQIYKAIFKKFPALSFATVYNTLGVLSRRGQITELNFDPLKKRFDPDPEPHHHMICVKCHKIMDVQTRYSIAPPEIEGEEFEIIRSHIEFYGLCSKCKNKKTNKKKEESRHV